MIAVGVLVGFLLDFLMPSKVPGDHRIFHYLTSIAITILVWEGNLHIDLWMNKRFPWLHGPSKRILVHLPVSVLFSAIAIFVSMIFFDSYVCKIPHTTRAMLMTSSTVIGLLVTLIVISMEIGAQFFQQWKRSLIEVEKYKAESTQAQLQNLKEQINPHFLFNNLSVLSSLVYKDQDKAVDFISQLSKVYRYLLDSPNSELITLSEELKFMESYTYLLKIRFDKNLDFKIDIPQTKHHLFLPPMALQLLIENAIKHNEVSVDLPLRISIEEYEDVLEVKNNLQVRSNKEQSSNTGLNNIRQRYKYYTDKNMEVLQDDNFFIVRIPLLHKS
jgi:LytS/YehU family sensor histidine kinase